MKDALGGGERMTNKKKTRRGLFQWSWADFIPWYSIALTIIFVQNHLDP